MKSQILSLLFFLLSASTAHATPKIQYRNDSELQKLLTKDNKKLLRVLYQFDTQHRTKISVLANKKSDKFIVKQDMSNTLEDALKCALRDITGAIIARSIGINANEVVFIPAGTTFPGKEITDLPATLHNFVPGVSMRKAAKKARWHDVSIHQYMKDGIPPKQWGLTRSIIKNMSLHEHLCKIVALDTFTANPDRSRNNYFYDEQTDSFYAIDFECSFRRNLAFYACRTIEDMLNTKHQKITPQERTGLKIYRDTLSQLIELYPPHTIQTYFIEIAKQGDAELAEKQTQVAMNLNEQYESKITNNFKACQQLVILLDRLLDLH